MPLPVKAKDVGVEICYLPAEFEDDGQNPYADRDLEIIRHVGQMEADSGPMEDRHRIQYSETLAAIERDAGVAGPGNDVGIRPLKTTPTWSTSSELLLTRQLEIEPDAVASRVANTNEASTPAVD